VLVPLTGVSAMIVVGAMYYNWRVTGNALLLPYQLHQRIYGTPQNLRWSAPVLEAPRARQQKDIWDNFEWQLGFFQWQSTWQGLSIALSEKLKSFWTFYLQPISSLPLLLLPLVVRRRGMRFLFFTGVFVLFAGCILYPFFFPHYAAPLCGLLLVLVLQGTRYLRVIRWRRMRVGAALFRWCIAAGVASCFLLVLGGVLDPEAVALGVTPRSRIAEDLKRRGGTHLVLVRYQPGHSFHHEWIYNSADIDKSRVIWARELDEASTRQLLRRYPDRDVWLAEPDREGSSVIAYVDRDSPQVSAILNAAGKGPYFRTGISPGSIVTLFGRNLGHSLEDHAGNCVLSGAQGDGRSYPETMLPGLDGARPGRSRVTIRLCAMPHSGSFKAVESIGRTLPDVEVTTTWGQPTLKVRGKMFVCIASHKSAEPNTLVVMMDFADRDALIEDDPGTYYLKEHYLNYPCVLVRLSHVRTDALRDLITGAHRFVSAKVRRKSSGGSRRRVARQPRAR